MSVLSCQTNITPLTVLEPEPVESIIPYGSPDISGGLYLGNSFNWNFDTSGNSFFIRSTVGLRPYRYYMIYYSFTVTSTVPIGSLTACALEWAFNNTLNTIQNPIEGTLPLNATVSGNLLQFQVKYSGSVALFADQPGDPQASPPGLSWRIALVKPAGLESTPTGYAIEITEFSAQEIGTDFQAQQSAGTVFGSRRPFIVEAL